MQIMHGGFFYCNRDKLTLQIVTERNSSLYKLYAIIKLKDKKSNEDEIVMEDEDSWRESLLRE
jgi:hypothetical protein